MPDDNAQQPVTRADLERFAEVIIGNISDLREDMNRRFEEVDRGLQALDRRLERTAESMRGIEVRMSALTKWADTYDRDNASMLSNQAAQQRAIDQLAQRVARIEREIRPGPQEHQPNGAAGTLRNRGSRLRLIT